MDKKKFNLKKIIFGVPNVNGQCISTKLAKSSTHFNNISTDSLIFFHTDTCGKPQMYFLFQITVLFFTPNSIASLKASS